MFESEHDLDEDSELEEQQLGNMFDFALERQEHEYEQDKDK